MSRFLALFHQIATTLTMLYGQRLKAFPSNFYSNASLYLMEYNKGVLGYMERRVTNELQTRDLNLTKGGGAFPRL
jgi:hypothetical protein